MNLSHYKPASLLTPPELYNDFVLPEYKERVKTATGKMKEFLKKEIDRLTPKYN